MPQVLEQSLFLFSMFLTFLQWREFRCFEIFTVQESEEAFLVKLVKFNVLLGEHFLPLSNLQQHFAPPLRLLRPGNNHLVHVQQRHPLLFPEKVNNLIII